MIYKQTDSTKKRLATLDPEFEDLIIRLINHCHERGINVQVSQAYRSNEEQQALYDIGRTKPGKAVTNAKPGTSFHNYGAAADLFFLNEKGEAYWSTLAFKKVWAVAKELGLDKQGLVWGGDFKSLVDYPHFQMGNSLEEAKKRFEKRRGKIS